MFSKGNSEDSTTVVLPKSTVTKIKMFITEREKGVYMRGMISDFINKAVLKEMQEGKKEVSVSITHTHSPKVSPKNKFLKIKGKLLNYILDHDYNPSMITEEQLTKAIIANAPDKIDITRINKNLSRHY